ncbi:LysR family transcriptional regulator [Antrihabitans sp. YC3-6]|uniref:LysR family transcriptional regulator n=1 Tax=Antrihabitans stalagmiti TaxID=2799499 RepID=A0A934NP40_9NOCA|nr:LysR substrate-binding domain-containing protein [Antrihabitans stalagmiti]MBJ8338796.1 LysR family transcriptional regulator [Antrihabitans stalagmiti]
MELRQLEYLVAVAEEANFTRAADRVHVAQPGISAQIRKLERELGQKLFDRSGRSVRLTDAGKAVMPYARAALGAVAGAHSAIEDLSGLVRGRIAVGVVGAGPTITFANHLTAFHAEHPGVDIVLAEADSATLLDRLRSGELDFVVVGLTNEPTPDLTIQILSEDPIVAAVGRDHPLAGRSSIPQSAMRDLSLITLPRGNGVRSRIEDVCARAGFAPRVAFETSNIAVLTRLTEAGVGVAIVPEQLVAIMSRDLLALRIRPEIRAQIALAWRTEGAISPAAAAFLRRIR